MCLNGGKEVFEQWEIYEGCKGSYVIVLISFCSKKPTMCIITYGVWFYSNIEIFWMLEKCESKTDNEECMINAYAIIVWIPHFLLGGWSSYQIFKKGGLTGSQVLGGGWHFSGAL